MSFRGGNPTPAEPNLTDLARKVEEIHSMLARLVGEKEAEEPRKTGKEDRELLFSDEVIKLLGYDRLRVPHLAIQRLIRSGDLVPIKIGRRLRFKREDIERLMEQGSRTGKRGRPKGSRNKKGSSD